MNELLLNFWIAIDDQERFLRIMKQIVIGIWITTILSGLFASYRFGEYMQTRRMVEENWHPVINSVIQST